MKYWGYRLDIKLRSVWFLSSQKEAIQSVGSLSVSASKSFPSLYSLITPGIYSLLSTSMAFGEFCYLSTLNIIYSRQLCVWSGQRNGYEKTHTVAGTKCKLHKDRTQGCNWTRILEAVKWPRWLIWKIHNIILKWWRNYSQCPGSLLTPKRLQKHIIYSLTHCCVWTHAVYNLTYISPVAEATTLPNDLIGVVLWISRK